MAAKMQNLIAVVVLAVAGNGCSSGIKPPAVPASEVAQGPIDKRVAMLLSVGSNPILVGSKDPFEYAARCSVALKKFRQEVGRRSILNPEQTALLDRIAARYQADARRIGTENGLSAEQQSERLQNIGAALSSAMQPVQVSMNCLKNAGTQQVPG